MDSTTFEIFNCVFTVALIVLVRYAVPWLKSQISADQLQAAEEYARLGVLTAEQILTDQTGKEKKIYVSNLMQEFCAAHGFKISADQVNTLIESAVKAVKS